MFHRVLRSAHGMATILCFGASVAVAGPQQDPTDMVARLRHWHLAQEHDSVIAIGTPLLEELPATARRERAEVEVALAIAHFFREDENLATRHAQQARALAGELADTAIFLKSSRVLSRSLFHADRYDEALQLDRMSLRMALAWSDPSVSHKALSDVAADLHMLGLTDSAEHYYRRALESTHEGDVLSRSGLTMNLAKLLSEKGEHQAAIAMLRPALQEYREHHDPKLHKAINTLAYVLHNAGQYREAIELFAESEELNQRSEMAISTTLENLGFMAEGQAALGDHAAAYATMLRLEEKLREFHARTANEEILALEKRFETRLKEEENALLRAENEVRRLNEDRLRNRWVAATAAALLLVALLGLLYRNYRQRGHYTREVERFNAELKAQRDEVQRINDLLELKILRAQLNPHFINNCQNSAIAMVREGRNVEALAYLQGLSKLMRMVLEHSVNDRITVEEEVAFLRLYVKLESLRLPGLRWEVDADRALIDDEADLPALLVQPFVENALWHGLAAKAGDRHLAIRFTATEKGLCCTVHDNGVGRNGQHRTDGQRSMGTELTNERLQLLSHRLQQKGSFAIHDLHDADGNVQGTKVVIELEG